MKEGIPHEKNFISLQLRHVHQPSCHENAELRQLHR